MAQAKSNYLVKEILSEMMGVFAPELRYADITDAQVGTEAVILSLRERYALGLIEVDEFERRVEEALR